MPCHGKTGLGDGPLSSALPTAAPSLAGAWGKSKRDQMVTIVLNGEKDMPAFKPVLDKKDAQKLVKWLEGMDEQKGITPPKKKSSSK